MKMVDEMDSVDGWGGDGTRVGGTIPPHPGVDSLAPARSALRAFGSAEFLSLLPKQLKSPKEKENAFQCLGNGKRRVRRAR